jgi:predicted enzyme related to lactoylglutathione lyase
MTMAEQKRPTPGQIGWIDLTVPDAQALCAFYQHVTGWTPSPVAMGGYSDYCMTPEGGEAVAGICHARGENAAMPPVWTIYITVRDLEESVRRVTERGGKVRVPARNMEAGRYCVIEDPAGAVAALFEPSAP